MRVPEALLKRRTELFGVIADTQARLDELDQIIRIIESQPELGDQDPEDTTAHRRSIRTLVLETVSERPGLTVENIAASIGNCRTSQVSQALSYWAEKGRIKEDSRVAGEWYPVYEDQAGEPELQP